ncbi:MAG: ABC transporter substrate-binding protein [Actinobacteria bacterium]|nr:ABC transporter substrate-binding protein [Actinomycetota bacterium]
MFRKLASILLVLALFLFLTGCETKTGAKSENKSESKGKVTQSELKKDTVLIAHVIMNPGCPQVLINQEDSIFTNRLKKLGTKVKFTFTRSLDNVYPLLDKGEPDFFYLPNSAFTTYITETSKFGGSNEYAIVAGSLDWNIISLVTRPEIKSFKDLDGKKVGIANLRYSDEYQLNEVLSTVGLKISSMGGTVEVVWDDVAAKLIDNYGNGKYDAITNFTGDNLPVALKKVPGSNVFSLNPDDLFGKIQPRTWLVVKKDLIKNNPELVKEVLKAHIVSTDRAKARTDKLPTINRDLYINYFKEQNADMSDVLAKHPLEEYNKRWKEVGITYDPNMEYVTGVFDFMDKRGLVKGKKLDDFVQIDLLNEALKEMGKPVIKE